MSWQDHMVNGEWYSQIDNIPLMNKLVGTKVVKVAHYWDEKNAEEGWKIYFDNGQILTARDGEYGDDALMFIEEPMPEE